MKKILHIALGSANKSLDKAIDSMGEVRRINWHLQPQSLNEHIEHVLQSFRPDITFMQLQTPGLIRKETLQKIPGIKINFTGDVREPIPQWYFDAAKAFDITLFTNGEDAEQMRLAGFKADVLYHGFEESVFNMRGAKQHEADVIFAGHDYGNAFPLGAFRREAVAYLHKQFPFEFAAYGNFARGTSIEEAAAIYRAAKIGINISQFVRDQYTSDRLYCIAACGAMIISHRYPAMELKENEEMIVFDSLPDLKEKIRYYLDHDEERSKIAEAGYKACWERATWGYRIKQLKEILKKHFPERMELLSL